MNVKKQTTRIGGNSFLSDQKTRSGQECCSGGKNFILRNWARIAHGLIRGVFCGNFVGFLVFYITTL